MRTRKFLSTLIPALPMLLTALLVILVTVIFLTAMRSKAHAQFGGIEQPMFQMASAGQTPEQIASVGLMYRWVASDLPTNEIVTNWFDRVQSNAWFHNDATKRPTNSATGIWFDPTHFLTNTPLSFGAETNIGVGFIFNPVWVQVGTHPGLLMNNATMGTDTGDVMGYAFQSTSYRLAIQGGGLFNAHSPSPYPHTNIWHDLVITQFGNYRSYTNGILSVQTAAGAWWGNPVLPVKTPNILGHNGPRNTGPRMWLNEVWIWTNAIQADIPSTTLSNFHYYGSVRYGYTNAP